MVAPHRSNTVAGVKPNACFLGSRITAALQPGGNTGSTISWACFISRAPSSDEAFKKSLVGEPPNNSPRTRRSDGVNHQEDESQ